MLRVVNVFLVLLTAAATCLLYGFKHQVGVQKARLAELHAAIDEERETIAVLRAEWSHLNDPRRLERLARRHLSLRPASARQIVSAEDAAGGKLRKVLDARFGKSDRSRPHHQNAVATY